MAVRRLTRPVPTGLSGQHALSGRAVHFGFFLGVLPVMKLVASELLGVGGLGIRKGWLSLWLPFKNVDSLTLPSLNWVAMALW